MTITLTLFGAISFAVSFLIAGILSGLWLVAGAKHEERRRITDCVLRKAENSKNPAAAKEILELVPIIQKQADTLAFWVNHDSFELYEKIIADFLEWNASEGERYFTAGDYNTAVTFFRTALNTSDNPEYKKDFARAKAMRAFIWAQTELENGNWAQARDGFLSAQKFAEEAGYKIPGEGEFLKKLNAAFAKVNLKKAEEAIGLFSRYIAEAKNQAVLSGVPVDAEIAKLYEDMAAEATDPFHGEDMPH